MLLILSLNKSRWLNGEKKVFCQELGPLRQEEPTQKYWTHDRTDCLELLWRDDARAKDKFRNCFHRSRCCSGTEFRQLHELILWNFAINIEERTKHGQSSHLDSLDRRERPCSYIWKCHSQERCRQPTFHRRITPPFYFWNSIIYARIVPRQRLSTFWDKSYT